MSRTVKVILSVIVVALLLAAGAAFAYGRSQQDQIADGVSVGGVDLSGLGADQARQKLAGELAPRLERPLTVKVDASSYEVAAARVDLQADLDAMVGQARDASQGSWFGARAVKDVTGQSTAEDLAARVTYSAPAVEGYVQQLARRVDRKPRDASVSASAAGLDVVPSKNGVVLDTEALASDLEARLEDPEASRTVVAEAAIRKPKVTTDQLAEQTPVYLIVNRGGFRLSFYKNLKLVKTYPIAVGQIGLETPAGLYHIQNKQVNPSWSVPNRDWAGDLAGKVIPPGPSNPLKARWMGIFDGAGIHGTADIASLGTAASHGCIRMAVPDVVQLYDQVPVGAPVYIA